MKERKIDPELMRFGRAFTDVVPGRRLEDTEIAELVELIHAWKEQDADSSSSSEEKLNIEELLEEGLSEIGIPADDRLVSEAARYVRTLSEANLYKQKRDNFIWFMRHIPDTPGGAALQRVLFGPCVSRRDAAESVGCDESTIREAERKFIRLLGLKILPRT